MDHSQLRAPEPSWKSFFLHLALLLSLGLIGSMIISHWLSSSRPELSEEEVAEAAMIVSSVTTPTVTALVAGWRLWHVGSFLLAAAATGGLIGGHVGTAAMAVVLASLVLMVCRGGRHLLIHRSLTHTPLEPGFTVPPEPYAELEAQLRNPTESEHESDYVDAGVYPVLEAKKLLPRLEAAGLEFYVESPHIDPAEGDNFSMIHHTAFGSAAQTYLFVHHKDLAAFDAIQAKLHRHETEASDGRSLLETFRSFAIEDDKQQPPS